MKYKIAITPYSNRCLTIEAENPRNAIDKLHKISHSQLGVVLEKQHPEKIGWTEFQIQNGWSLYVREIAHDSDN